MCCSTSLVDLSASIYISAARFTRVLLVLRILSVIYSLKRSFRGCTHRYGTHHPASRLQVDEATLTIDQAHRLELASNGAEHVGQLLQLLLSKGCNVRKLNVGGCLSLTRREVGIHWRISG